MTSAHECYRSLDIDHRHVEIEELGLNPPPPLALLESSMLLSVKFKIRSFFVRINDMLTGSYGTATTGRTRTSGHARTILLHSNPVHPRIMLVTANVLPITSLMTTFVVASTQIRPTERERRRKR